METKTEYPVHLLIQLNTLAREAIAKNDLEILTKAVRLAEEILGFSLEGFESFGAIKDTATVLVRCVREFSGWKVGAEDLPGDTHEQRLERRLDREEARRLKQEADRRTRNQCQHCHPGSRGPECPDCEQRFVGALKGAAKRYVEIVRNEQDGIETHSMATFCDVVALSLDQARFWGGALSPKQAADIGLAKGMAAWNEICELYSSDEPDDEPEDAETQAWLDDLDRKAWRHMRDIAELVINAIEMEEDLSFSTLCRLVAAGVRGLADGEHVSLGMGEPPANGFLDWSERYRVKRERAVDECIDAAIADAARQN